MKSVRLGDVAVINPTWDKSVGLDDPVSFVGMASMSDEAGKTIDEEIRTVGQVRKGFTSFRRNDLLVAKITPCFENGKIGRAAITNQLGAGSTEFHVVRPGKDLDGTFALHFLRSPSFRASGELRMTGSGGQRRVPAAYVADAVIPLPPLEEQRRIAAILHKADELRTRRRQALAHLDTLTQSIFHSMFGDPATNEQAFEKKPIVQLCSAGDDIRCGPFGTQLKRADFTSNGVPLWGIRNVNKFFELPTEEFVSAETAERLAVYDIRPGDIVMTRKGTIGNCALYPAEFPVGLMHSDLLRVRVNTDVVSAKFLAEQLHSSRDVDRQIRLISGGAIMAGINVGKLKSIQVVVPPLELQRTFAERVAAVERLKETHRKHLAELDALFASLQHRAFKGEL